MNKDGSSKKKKKQSKPPPEGPGGVKEKPSAKPKKMVSEIDEIFAARKRKKPENENNVNTSKPAKSPAAAKAKSSDRTTSVKSSKSKISNSNVFQDDTRRSKRKTADGLTIYTEEELGFGKSDAGGTRLCPFDCDCCF